MKNKTTLFIIILNTLICLFLLSCEPSRPIVVSTDTDTNKIKVEKIMGEVEHGLYKFKLNDSTTILIYRGVESCTMLQLK